MALRTTLTRLDRSELPELYDHAISAYVSRNSGGEVEITKESANAHVSMTLQSLVSGPCAGHSGNALDVKIKSVMSQLLREEEIRQGVDPSETDTQEVPEIADEDDDDLLDALAEDDDED